MEENIHEQIKAVYSLCNLRNSYERDGHFIKAVLVHPEVIGSLIDKRRINDYSVIAYKGDQDIYNFLNSRDNFSEKKKKKSKLLVFESKDSKVLSKIIWTLRGPEGKTSRKWLLNQIHWENCYSELKINLGDATMDLNEDNYVKRMIADDW